MDCSSVSLSLNCSSHGPMLQLGYSGQPAKLLEPWQPPHQAASRLLQNPNPLLGHNEVHGQSRPANPHSGLCRVSLGEHKLTYPNMEENVLAARRLDRTTEGAFKSPSGKKYDLCVDPLDIEINVLHTNPKATTTPSFD